jgi:hypothetical protein
MTATKKFERNVVAGLTKLLANEILLDRWRLAGRLLSVVGFALVFLSLIAAVHAPMVERHVVFVALIGGVFVGLGLWFTCFSAQWPIFRQFIDRTALEKRSSEIDV